MLSINELVDLIGGIAGKKISKARTTSLNLRAFEAATATTHALKKSSTGNRVFRLEDGLQRTYAWIAGELRNQTMAIADSNYSKTTNAVI